MIVELDLFGLRLKTGLNNREVVMARVSRVRKERERVQLAWIAGGHHRRKLSLPAVVTITRIGPRFIDDDNIAGAAKSVRDELAVVLGVNDRDPRVCWLYRQEKGRYSCKVKIVTDAVAETVVRTLPPAANEET